MATHTGRLLLPLDNFGAALTSLPGLSLKYMSFLMDLEGLTGNFRAWYHLPPRHRAIVSIMRLIRGNFWTYWYALPNRSKNFEEDSSRFVQILLDVDCQQGFYTCQRAGTLNLFGISRPILLQHKRDRPTGCDCGHV